MINFRRFLAAVIAGSALYAVPASALVTTAGAGGFDNGFATQIIYEDDNAIANRGTSNNRDNPLNALGSANGDFFEIGLGSTIDLTFGTTFDTSISVFEITFGNRDNFVESADVFVGLSSGGPFQLLGSITNALEQTVLSVVSGVFDTVRITDTTTTSAALGGFDVDAVRVQPIPLPASVLLLLSGIGGLALLRRRRTPGAMG